MDFRHNLSVMWQQATLEIPCTVMVLGSFLLGSKSILYIPRPLIALGILPIAYILRPWSLHSTSAEQLKLEDFPLSLRDERFESAKWMNSGLNQLKTYLLAYLRRNWGLLVSPRLAGILLQPEFSQQIPQITGISRKESHLGEPKLLVQITAALDWKMHIFHREWGVCISDAMFRCSLAVEMSNVDSAPLFVRQLRLSLDSIDWAHCDVHVFGRRINQTMAYIVLRPIAIRVVRWLVISRSKSLSIAIPPLSELIANRPPDGSRDDASIGIPMNTLAPASDIAVQLVKAILFNWLPRTDNEDLSSSEPSYFDDSYTTDTDSWIF